MIQSSVTKFSVSLHQEFMRYLETYQREQGIPSRSKVLEQALTALREKQLAQSYREWAQEFRANPDPLADVGSSDGLEPSDGKKWL